MTRKHGPSTVLASVFAVALGAIASAAQDDVTFDFEALAKEFVAEHELAVSDGGFAGVLDSDAFVRVELGSFDLRFPAESVADGSTADELRECALTLVDLQRAWFLWRSKEPESEELTSDWATLQKWVKSWSAGRLRRCAGGSAPLYEQLNANDKVRAAQERLRAYTRPPQETIDAVGDLNVIVLAPTREQFLQFAAVAGLVEPSLRKALWDQGVLKHTLAWVSWIQLVALRESELPFNAARPFGGGPMTDRDKTGLAQYVADRGAALLLRKEFFRHGTHFFEESLGTNLVIAAVGKNDLRAGEWKLEYKTSGSSTAAYERFVPGGNPSGGTLPKRSAGAGIISGSAVEISRYRSNVGVGFFLDPLQEGQKLGAKLASKDKENPLRTDKLAHFELYSYKEHEAGYVSAPFLGQGAVDKALPPLQFLDDYEDFFRAYRAAFVHWFRTHGAGSEADSEAKFAELIARHAVRPAGTPLHELVEDLYGVPMSAADGSTDSLEWRFLAFVKKGR